MPSETSPYHSIQVARRMPRLPLEGSLDLTYRCNNVCRHCWLWLPVNASEQMQELSFDEIRDIAAQARALGTRSWHISGGEPMLREDFSEIFDLLTRKATQYSLNTNGTLITPAIAQLLTRKGNKMVALYGATAATYDHVTRNPGGFEQAMRGFRYLQEAGAGFTVQLIPMRDNWHEWEQMQQLADSLSRHVRVGAAWLYKSACGSAARNAEIDRQRLDPRAVVELDLPDMTGVGVSASSGGHQPLLDLQQGDDRIFSSCVAGRRSFHIDPYGGMSFCCFIKDPALRYDLRRGTFQDAWDHFIPSLGDAVHGGPEYTEGCATCDLRGECRWCGVYSYLEHGRYSAKLDYLCAAARENRQYREDWLANHRRYYQIGGITLQVDSDLPMTPETFSSKLELFRVDGPGEDTVALRHHFQLLDVQGKDLGKQIYRRPPWAIYQLGNSWVYLGISPQEDNPDLHRVATFNHDHTRARIYNKDEDQFLKGGHNSLTLFPSDQILVARLLADRNGCYLHSAGAILNGAGMLFVGHSEAGKSTTTRILMGVPHPEPHPQPLPILSDGEGGTNPSHSLGGQGGVSQGEGYRAGLEVEILCDDRNIVRRFTRQDGSADWRVYGTWSHGDVAEVSPASAPLRAICFIEKAAENTLIPLQDGKEINRRLLACVIKPFVTADWWNKTLDVIEALGREIPCYVMRFDKSGAIVTELIQLAGSAEKQAAS